MRRRTIRDGQDTFEADVYEGRNSSCGVLFAVGGGGDPERHGPLLEALREAGATVVAPRFERMVGPRVDEARLTRRVRHLRLAWEASERAGLPWLGMGHSIGGTALLMLAGAEAWLGPGRPVARQPTVPFAGLRLFAPPTGFFQGAGSLDAVQTRVQLWMGERDRIVAPSQAEVLRGLGERLELEVVPEAGHFAFMDEPPPHTPSPMPEHGAFLRRLHRRCAEWVAQRGSASEP